MRKSIGGSGRRLKCRSAWHRETPLSHGSCRNKAVQSSPKRQQKRRRDGRELIEELLDGRDSDDGLARDPPALVSRTGSKEVRWQDRQGPRRRRIAGAEEVLKGATLPVEELGYRIRQLMLHDGRLQRLQGYFASMDEVSRGFAQ